MGYQRWHANSRVRWGIESRPPRLGCERRKRSAVAHAQQAASCAPFPKAFSCTGGGIGPRRKLLLRDRRRQLEPCDRPRGAAHRIEILIGGAAALVVSELGLRRDPPHVDQPSL